MAVLILKLPKSVQPHTFTAQPYEGSGAYGPIFGTEFEFQGYYASEKEYIRNDEGDELISSSQIYTSEDLDLPQKSLVNFEGNDEEVMTVNKYYNAMTGKHSNTKVMLK